MVICIIGGSGSGKDTQGKILAEKLGIPHVSMGQIMRDQAKEGNPLAVKAVNDYINKGLWVPGDIVAILLQQHLVDHCQNGCILNGFPRSMEQYEYFSDILAEIDQKLAAVVHISVPDEILMERMQKQAQSAERDDTGAEIIKQRLRSYHESVVPVLNRLRSENLLIDIDGTPSIQEVHESIVQALKPIIKK